MPKRQTPKGNKMTTSDNGQGPKGEAGKTQQLAIDKIVFTASAPYSEGDTINESEASALNQLRAENLRNNFRKKVAAASEAGGGTISDEAMKALLAEFSEYDAKYEFAGRRGPRASLDPVLKEAQNLARSKIREALRKKKQDPKNLPEGAMDKLVADLLAKKPEFMEAAKARVAAAQSIAADILG
jgi:hypothetical protein